MNSKIGGQQTKYGQVEKQIKQCVISLPLSSQDLLKGYLTAKVSERGRFLRKNARLVDKWVASSQGKVISCLSRVLTVIPQEDVVGYIFEQKVRNDLTYNLLKDIFTNERGEFVFCEKEPLRVESLAKLETGMNAASQLLRAKHNEFFADIKKQFPSAHRIGQDVNVKLCNDDSYGYHEFRCNRADDKCMFASRRGILTSRVTYKGIVKAMLTNLYGKLIISDSEELRPKSNKASSPAHPYSSQEISDYYGQLVQLVSSGNFSGRYYFTMRENESAIFLGKHDKLTCGLVKMTFADYYDMYADFILFMLAHEQGHYALQLARICDGKRTEKERRDDELEADKYAAYLMERVYNDSVSITQVPESGIYPWAQGISFIKSFPGSESTFITNYFKAGGFGDGSYPAIQEREAAISEGMRAAGNDSIKARAQYKEEKKDAVEFVRLYLLLRGNEYYWWSDKQSIYEFPFIASQINNPSPPLLLDQAGKYPLPFMKFSVDRCWQIDDAH
jgi:hypothetical protein